MRYTVNPYLVDLAQLQAVYGCRDAALRTWRRRARAGLQALIRHYPFFHKQASRIMERLAAFESGLKSNEAAP